jgi:branched-chain amino acid aminotransferase
MNPFILKNGTFLAAGEKLFTVADAETLLFSEKIRAIRNSFPFLEETLDLLLLKFRIFNEPLPDILRSGGKDLKRQMERLLVKNKLYKSAVISVYFFRNGIDTDYILSAGPLGTFEFELKNKGLLVDVFDKMPKAISGLSNLSVGSETVWKVAASHLPGSGYDEFLLINSEDKIIEGIGKKLFLVKNDKITGVSASAGAYMDVSGAIVPILAKKTQLSYSETDGFTTDQLYQADELFLSDAVYGIHSILGFREKRYYSTKTRELNAALNGYLIRTNF